MSHHFTPNLRRQRHVFTAVAPKVRGGPKGGAAHWHGDGAWQADAVHRPRVLLVGHDASRTGAPIAALTFLRWLAARDLADPSALLLAGGPLAPEYARTVPTGTAAMRGPSLLDRVADGFESVGWPAGGLRPGADRWRTRGASRAGPEIVVANTVAAWPAAAVAAEADGARLVCWVHELDHVAGSLLQGHDRHALGDRTDQFLAAGRRVAAMLVDRWNVPAERVAVVPEPVEALTAAIATPASPENEPRPPRRVLGVGSGVPRKGVDAFVAVMAVLARERPDLDAAWVGIGPSAPLAREAATDVASTQTAAMVRLRPPTDDLADEWARAAVLLHTAREDPFPLVVIEAAQRAIPTVTWDTGGAADLVRGAGLGHLVAPPGDLLGLAERVGSLLDDEPARLVAGEELRDHVAPHDVAVAGPVAWNAIAGTPP